MCVSGCKQSWLEFTTSHRLQANASYLLWWVVLDASRCKIGSHHPKTFSPQQAVMRFQFIYEPSRGTFEQSWGNCVVLCTANSAIARDISFPDKSYAYCITISILVRTKSAFWLKALYALQLAKWIYGLFRGIGRNSCQIYARTFILTVSLIDHGFVVNLRKMKKRISRNDSTQWDRQPDTFTCWSANSSNKNGRDYK